MKKKYWIIALISISAAALLITLIFYLSAHNRKKPYNEETKETEFTAIDADAYYQENATIISKTPADQSDKVTAKSVTVELLTQRGFGDCEVLTYYSTDGDDSEDSEINGASSNVYPMYYAYYSASNEDIWTIEVINGIVTAYPASYNMYHSDEVPVIFSESDIICGYDELTNQFYEIIPNDSVMKIKTVDKITSELLDSLSEGGIE